MSAVGQDDKDRLDRLIRRAVGSHATSTLASVANTGRAFEVYCLAVVLRLLRRKGYRIAIHNAPAGVISLPGGPARPDKTLHTYFTATYGAESLEVWVSVETTTLGSTLPVGGAPGTRGAYHEIDVGVYRAPLTTATRPGHDQLVFAASCKYRKASKEHVREALGLRRETAFFDGLPLSSTAPWFTPAVPADPAMPMVLFSRDAGITAYAAPADRWGLYVRAMAFSLKAP